MSQTRRDTFALVLLVVPTLVVRAVFLDSMATAPFDPWRHLALIESIRAGEGFSLYEGQPFIWYSPIWHYLCAWFPPSIKPEWIAGFVSILSVVLFYLWLRCRLGRDSSAAAATAAAKVVT